jgi:hypothetical protein
MNPFEAVLANCSIAIASLKGEVGGPAKTAHIYTHDLWSVSFRKVKRLPRRPKSEEPDWSEIDDDYE